MDNEKSPENLSNINQTISLIIPAFNEGNTIAGVVLIAKTHPWISEVIVVDDGSEDNTAVLSKEAGAKVIRLEKNQGKAAAMDAGVNRSTNEILCFIDADVTGLTLEILSEIIGPVVGQKLDMFIGILARKSNFTNNLLPYLPKLSGNRAMNKGLWKMVPGEYKKSFQIEIALNYYAKKKRLKIGSKIYASLGQAIKEEKRGFWPGIYQRMLMVGDIIIIFIKLYIIKNISELAKNKDPLYIKNS